ncbi:hypothetical protein FC961_00145 [Clostridium botulinum]|nr:hypothetical protein [Clostridium botulinum]NFO90312.1 hypothetical protein [Clostridium botulinum]
MKVLYKNEYTELKMLVNSKNHRKILIKTIMKYPVNYKTIREMILKGLKAKQIKDMCTMCFRKGLIISDYWNNINNLLQQEDILRLINLYQ